MRLALFQPDIPQNTGAMMRLCACLGVGLDIIEPCGFVWDERKIRRAGMDYMDHLEYARHVSWARFFGKKSGRIVLLTTKTGQNMYDFAFKADDVLLMGRESAGVPDEVHQAVGASVTIPMRHPLRSLNVATAAALALGEALRQTGGFVHGG
jgi:tRNA (cytidine/uridine-2'-O-)-methyltransferase